MAKQVTNKRHFITSLIFFCFSVNMQVLAAIKLPAIFSDNMVLQQKSKTAFWGRGTVGEKVSVNGSWSSKIYSTTVDNSGKWKLFISTPKAGGPYTVNIAATNTIILKDILIGEVWVCSGQSNMVFALKSSDNAKQEIAAADYPEIRYFSVNRQYGTHDFEDAPGSVWQKTSPATAGSFSAVAYYFAQKINKDLKVPVGLIYAAWGGTPAEAWTPAEVLQNDTALNKYNTRWQDIQNNVRQDSLKYFADSARWKKDSTTSNKPEEPQTLYYYRRPWREPAVLFNGMIEPFIQYTIKGILWYQGESNVGYASEYENLFGSMIKSWRAKWKQTKNLPFYYVQIAPFGYSNLDAAAQIREAQYNLMKAVPNTGMAVTMGLGNMKDIHYTHKKKVGERLALIALAKNYGYKNLVYKGPEPDKIKIKNGRVFISYTSETLTTKDEVLKGFELGYTNVGSDSLMYMPASAIIENGKVMVWNDEIIEPREVRYGWLLPGEANLYDGNDLPAFPFRKKLNSFKN